MATRSRGAYLLPLAMLAACKERKPPVPDAGPPAPSIGLTVAERHLETPTRLAIGTEGETSWRIVLATAPLSCAALRKRYPERPETRAGTLLDFWLARPIEPSGEPGAWAFRSGFITDDEGDRGLGARGAMLDSVTAKAGRLRVEDLELALTDFRSEILWTGDLDAELCGRVARRETDRHQDELELRIGDTPIEVRGMSLFASDKRLLLRLSHGPHDCNSVFTEGYDLYVDLTLDGDPPKVTLVSLNGDAFPETPSRSEGLESLNLEIDGELDDSGPLRGKFEGAADIRGYKMAVEGSFEALRCVEGGSAPAAPSGSKR
jgi:hypothetical protein